jgi:ribonuclease HII
LSKKAVNSLNYIPDQNSQFPSLSELPELAYCDRLVAGIDEVGRGCLFGPVVAGAVILPISSLSDLAAAGVKDSKQLSPGKRQKLAEEIKAVSLDWAIGYASTKEIDLLNIFHASLLAMKRAVLKLKKVQPDICLVDGKWIIPELTIPQQALIKGDRRSLAIASASILAKVWRDDLIDRLAVKYPMYDLKSNKGYGTTKHLSALQQYGASPLHRLSFSPCRQVASLQFKIQNSKFKIKDN